MGKDILKSSVLALRGAPSYLFRFSLEESHRVLYALKGSNQSPLYLEEQILFDFVSIG